MLRRVASDWKLHTMYAGAWASSITHLQVRWVDALRVRHGVGNRALLSLTFAQAVRAETWSR